MIQIFFTILLYQQIGQTSAWGSIGHGLVARLAQSQLTSSANQWIKNYLSDDLSGDLSRIASWPDLILYSDTNPIDYNSWQWSRELHFIDIPDWNCTYLPTRDCVNDRCVEGALKNYSHRLISSDFDYVAQQEALYFLVHFVGDVHQPLHSGFKGDYGGNAVKGFFMNGTNQTNLHKIWDEEIINNRIRRHFKSDLDLYYDYLRTLMLNQSMSMNETGTEFLKWIDESIGYVCNEIYFDENHQKMNRSHPFKLADEYFSRSWPLVDQRLTQGGFRLALLLNQLSKNHSRMRLTPQMQALIVTICTAILVGVVVGLVLYCLSKRQQSDAGGAPLLSEDA